VKAGIRSKPAFRFDNVVETAGPALLAALAELRTCRGAECRRLEDLAPMDGGSRHLAAQSQ
jgi:hypothetical protein